MTESKFAFQAKRVRRQFQRISPASLVKYADLLYLTLMSAIDDSGDTMDEARARGEALRCEMLGNNYREKVSGDTSPVSADLRALSDVYCWGTVWSRPQLSLRDRSLASLSMLVARHQMRAFAIEIAGALHNGVSRMEIAELILQSAVYCGIPNALEAMSVFETATKEME